MAFIGERIVRLGVLLISLSASSMHDVTSMPIVMHVGKRSTSLNFFNFTKFQNTILVTQLH